jgi:hypothetical protein
VFARGKETRRFVGAASETDLTDALHEAAKKADGGAK